MSKPRITKRSLRTRLITPESWEWDALDHDAIVSAAVEALTRPSNSGWWDEEMYVTHTLMFSTPDPSLTDDYTIGASNLRCIAEDMRAAYPHAVEESSFGHWTYSRFLALKVRVIDSHGRIHPAFVDAMAIAWSLERDYPLYNDEDHSNLEWEIWESTVASALADVRAGYGDTPDAPEGVDRDSESWGDAWLESVHEDNEGYGYHECTYVSDDVTGRATAHADAIHLAALAMGLTVPNESGEPLPGLESRYL
jgi:hypothetical protein